MTPGSNRRGVALVSAAHVINDTYQGVVPALLPFLVSERHYSYAAVSGLTLAATVLSSVAQPFFGWWTDRRPRRWMITAGLLTAGAGVSAVGLFSSYLLTWVVIALSGLGIAAFHPEAARAARQAAGNSNRAMSVFVLGGNSGFALGSLVTAPVLLWAGLRGTVLLIVPALFMAVILVTRLTATLDRPGHRRVSSPTTGVDDWRAFLLLTSVVVVRSMLFFGLTSFLALYVIHERGASPGVGGASLSVFLVAGGAGTLLGGWVADRHGRLASIRIGFVLTVPALVGLVSFTSLPVILVFVVLCGIGIFMPFSVFVILGQDYLPSRIGTASGVTIGLGVSIGGLFSPLLGWLADNTSLRFTLSTLIALPLLAVLLSAFMHDPATSGPSARPPHPRLPDDQFV
jgi:FSR family fosmidomycin resistance protein-like MFS transporter